MSSFFPKLFPHQKPTNNRTQATLHREFNRKRVNAINRRKEFFSVSPDEIKKTVHELNGSEVDFKMTALADEYYETLRLLGN